MPNPSDPRLVFAGTPKFAATHLRAMMDAGIRPLAVYTRPDRPSGRGRKIVAGAVRRLAETAGLEVRQPSSLNDAGARAELAALRPDLAVVVAYGSILPQAVLDIPRYGCINVHGSLLPRWRGAAPIQRTVEAGDERGGVTVMRMDAGLDTGPILAQSELAIEPGTTAGELHDRLAALGSTLLPRVLTDVEACLAAAVPQDEARATYARKVEKSEAELDWSRPADELSRRIHAFNPRPGCWSTLGDDRIKLWRAEPARGAGRPGEIIEASRDRLVIACGEDALAIAELQLPGGRAMPATELLKSRGEMFRRGAVLEQCAQ